MKAATFLGYAKLMGTLFFWRLNIVLCLSGRDTVWEKTVGRSGGLRSWTGSSWRSHYALNKVMNDTLPAVLKGIVHPKMKILSSFTHPQVVPNLYECVCSAEHKGRYFEESLEPGCFGAPLTSIVGKTFFGWTIPLSASNWRAEFIIKCVMKQANKNELKWHSDILSVKILLSASEYLY